MTESEFKKAWDYWCGLFPVWTRQRAAYFKALRWIRSEDFKRVVEIVVNMIDDFPSVRQVREANAQLKRGDGTAEATRPDDKLPYNKWGTSDLEAHEERLKLMIKDHGGRGNASSFNINLVRIWESSLVKVRGALSGRKDKADLDLMDQALADDPPPPSPLD